MATPKTDKCEAVNAHRKGSAAERASIYMLSRLLETQVQELREALIRVMPMLNDLDAMREDGEEEIPAVALFRTVLDRTK